MADESLIIYLALIFSGAALLATLALFARQAMIVAYLILGLLLGPSVLNLVPDIDVIHAIAKIGIIFLLFLLGLNLHPQKLFKLFGETLLTTVASSLLFASVGFGFGLLAGFDIADAMLIGTAMMFSSTIIGLKLLPTTVLHHQHTGELIISILLLQDILAIIVMMFIGIGSGETDSKLSLLLPFITLPCLILVTKFIQQTVINYLLTRFDAIQEYIFLLTIGWCLGIALLANALGLSLEIGAFAAGVSIAASPISTFIAESLKPLRDFFLVLFFFALGASADLNLLLTVLLPGILLAAIILLLKPLVFSYLLRINNEPAPLATEIGVRLGQISEFSLLIVILALEHQLVSAKAAGLIQLAMLITFIVSPYLIVFRYPSPIAVDPRLRRT
jgi:Kef-type K+ transport system membrane component KefB